jgi:ribosomal protein L11 methylase PrmA
MGAIHDAKRVLDLYCGSGLFSLPLGVAGARVIGIDDNLGAVNTAKENARRNGYNNTRFFAGDAASACVAAVTLDLAASSMLCTSLVPAANWSITTPSNDSIFLSAKVVESRSDRATIEGTLSAAGKVCATCRGTFVAVKEGHPAYHRW